MQANDHRGYSREMDIDGYYVDPNHPSNRPRPRWQAGTDATKLQTQHRGGGENKNTIALLDRWGPFAERLS